MDHPCNLLKSSSPRKDFLQIRDLLFRHSSDFHEARRFSRQPWNVTDRLDEQAVRVMEVKRPDQEYRTSGTMCGFSQRVGCGVLEIRRDSAPGG